MTEIKPGYCMARVDTRENWEAKNTFLLERQWGVVDQFDMAAGDDRGKMKMGPGKWNDLPYLVGADGIAADIAVDGTETLAYGVPASVENRGDKTHARLLFRIPMGYPGTTVPDITGLAEAEEAENEDLLYLWDKQSGILKKIAWEQLQNPLLDRLDRLVQMTWPIGSPYIQRLNDPAPVERGLPGTWETWSHRADAYGLSMSVPARSDYIAGYNYAAGAVAMYHLAGDDYALFKAKEAITGAPAQLDPVKWDKVAPGLIIERRFLQDWTDADFGIGKQIEDGAYKGMYVTEIIVPGGKFPSMEGGNRGTFVSGGVRRDQDRLMKTDNPPGSLKSQPVVVAHRDGENTWRGPIGLGNRDTTRTLVVLGSNYYDISLIFDNSRVVPTGPDNAPRTLSTRLWRRVA